MTKSTDFQMALYRARLLLEEGHNETALSVLEQAQPENEQQKREIAYLLGWCYVQLKRWHDAIDVLSPLIDHFSGFADEDTQIERERLAHFLLRLGVAATNLSHYDDASRHFTLCLKILQERRVHLPAVRIKARYSLATVCLERGMYSTAVEHYEEALRLCRHYGNSDELPHIYHGLCKACMHTGDLKRASMAGEEALHLYQQRQDRSMEARMDYMLGRTRFLSNDFRNASDYYTESLAIATSHNSPTMIMLNCASLAELRMTEGRLEEARRYCRLALDNLERAENVHMRGITYHIVGKVAHEEAKRANGSIRHQLLEEAEGWFVKAREQLTQTHAYADMAETYQSSAQVLEELGNTEQAIECLRSGYAVLSHVNEMK